jgi:hypothetical protein
MGLKINRGLIRRQRLGMALSWYQFQVSYKLASLRLKLILTLTEIDSQ